MSSPNHPTFDIEDAFSSNSPDYVSASSDYFLTSPGNTSSDSSVNPSGLIPIASPTQLLFNDDPYMKVIHAYYAKESPIPTPITSPAVLSPSLVLPLPLFNPWDFFVLEELLPPKKQVCFLSSSSTDSTSTSEAPAMTQDIKKLVADTIFVALEAQAANMVNTDNTTRPRETPVSRKCTYEEFMSCQPFYFNEQADKIAWTKLKRILTNKYCPRTEVKKIEDEFYNLVIKGNDLKTYNRRFQELALLCLNMVPNSKKLMEVFIEGLPRSIEGNVTASKPQTLEEAITITQRLMEQVIKHNSAQETNDHKQKFEDGRNTTNNNNYPNDRNNNNRSNNRNNNNYQNNRNNNHNDHVNDYLQQ
nr:reverse transcriptase domain-containing protein [Tanacetum cinerariifolium]GEZ89066.1 reverse transcriptase domain-containing protein [Tanacetum cinerariifolium]